MAPDQLRDETGKRSPRPVHDRTLVVTEGGAQAICGLMPGRVKGTGFEFESTTE